MVGSSDRHVSALGEMVEWWHDLARQEINSRTVLLPVPLRWGRTHLLNEFATFVENHESVSIVIRVPGASLPDGLGLQALELRGLFTEARVKHPVAELLGADRLGGVTQLGLGMAGLFVSPLAALVGLLLAGIGVGAAGKVWDNSLAGQEGMVARLARAVAAVSVSVPVVVIIDDADRLDPDLAVVLVENLIGRVDGRVLVVAAVNPGCDLMSALTSRAAYGLTEGRVRAVDADPGMDYQARVELAAELCPQLPSAATRRIGQRTQTFAEVFRVASTERLAEMDAQDGDTAVVTAADEVIDARASQAPPSGLAVVLAWAGGILHSLQAERALQALRQEMPGEDDDVIRFESLIRLADPASPRPAEQVRVLATGQRQRLADIVLDAALEVGGDPGASLVDKVVAWQAAHRIRADLQDRALLVGIQRQLVHGLEDLGDAAAAYQVAAAALAEYPSSQPGDEPTPEQNELATAVLRLARIRQSRHADPLIEATIEAVAAGGATVGLEARVWAAIDLLGQPDQRDRALELTGQVTAELNSRDDLGAVGNRWRLQLAFQAGRAGYPAIAQQLVAPLLDTSVSPEEGDAGRAVLAAVGGPRADTRLQIVGLEAELTALPPDADDGRLRVHHALATDYGDLGDYRSALRHGRQELLLRRRIQGADHRDTLTARSMIALWTGRSGHLAEALRLYNRLLRDRERVLGRDDPDTLGTRFNIATCIGEMGDRAKALRLYQDVLRDRERIRGPNHPETMNTLNNIAAYTGELGDHARAVVLFEDLLARRERVLGPNHPDTLMTRNNAALQTGLSGDPVRAVRLFQELLADLKRVFDPEHPYILGARSNLASFVGQSGHRVEALRLYQELLPDQERVLGRDHPETLITRRAIQRLSRQG